MPTEYSEADDTILAIVTDQLRRNHPELHETKGVIMAYSTDGSPAVKHHGAPVLACIKVISAKDRTKKKIDAEILIDSRLWEKKDDEEHAATIDHELSHLERVEWSEKKLKSLREDDPNTPEWKLDCHGRPRLRTIPADFTPTDAFTAVIKRHGHKSVEVTGAKAYKEFVESALKSRDK